MAIANCEINDFVSDSMYFTLFVKSSNKSPPFLLNVLRCDFLLKKSLTTIFLPLNFPLLNNKSFRFCILRLILLYLHA